MDFSAAFSLAIVTELDMCSGAAASLFHAKSVNIWFQTRLSSFVTLIMCQIFLSFRLPFWAILTDLTLYCACGDSVEQVLLACGGPPCQQKKKKKKKK
jgi:hypothetical protein